MYTGTESNAKTSTGLSTQILIKVDGQAIGGIQSFSADQSRPLKRITEVGTDGTVEIVPSGPTDVSLTIERIYFARKQITEALNRSFLNIQAQRYPFDIYVYDYHNVAANSVATNGDYDVADNVQGVITTIYENCWIKSKRVSYNAGDYIIMENVGVDVEFCHSFAGADPGTSAALSPSGYNPPLHDIERLVDRSRPGSMDARGLRSLSDVFGTLGS